MPSPAVVALRAGERPADVTAKCRFTGAYARDWPEVAAAIGEQDMGVAHAGFVGGSRGTT